MTSEDNGDLESFVASQYELVRRILESLTDLDLDACEKVNTLWANAVKVERNSDHRRRIQMFSWKGKAQTTRVIYVQIKQSFLGGCFLKFISAFYKLFTTSIIKHYFPFYRWLQCKICCLFSQFSGAGTLSQKVTLWQS